MLVEELNAVAATTESAIEHCFGVFDHGEVLADEFFDFAVEHWIVRGRFQPQQSHV